MLLDWKFLFYWWHRWRHEVMLFWDLFHQMHHSPKRVVTLTAYYVHPAEVVISSMLNGAMIYGLLGGSYEVYLVSGHLFLCGYWLSFQFENTAIFGLRDSNTRDAPAAP